MHDGGVVLVKHFDYPSVTNRVRATSPRKGRRGFAMHRLVLSAKVKELWMIESEKCARGALTKIVRFFMKSVCDLLGINAIIILK